MSLNRNGGICGALQKAPPPMPPGLARRLSNKENYGLGKVKVMLRVSDTNTNDTTTHFMSVDKKKRQVTVTDSSNVNTTATPLSQNRSPMVAAPKMFAFDGIFTTEDQQYDVCSSALSEVIPAVLEGSDGCFLTIGYPNSGQSKTMFGDIISNNELGAITCAISWLYKGINDRRQKSGSRFSVRVSALGISSNKSDSSAKDLLAAYATESDDSPGVYFREDFLGGPTELRAPTAERAALFLDAALAARPHSDLDPAIIFTMHVYQYSLSRKGGVAGGRSRLHFIDLGGCANRNGGLPLSGIGNIILAILSGQRHPPNKDHPLTPLLKDCLGPLTCHVSILAHISYTQAYVDALTTIQIASRIHRMRRRKHRFPIPVEKNISVPNAIYQSAGSSDGPDPSSSDLSADTVIYMGPCDDATDGEHPPVYLPSLSSEDNRCSMNKALKGTGLEKQLKPGRQKPQSPITSNRTNCLKRCNVSNSTINYPSQLDSQSKSVSGHSTSKTNSSTFRGSGVHKASNCPTPKGSPFKRPTTCGSTTSSTNIDSQFKKISEEHWIDGPRLSKAKIAEARHLLREINHVKNCETWIDGPKTISIEQPKHLTQPKHHSAKALTNSNFLSINNDKQSITQNYGFMDSHKKTMIRQWVENQSSHIFQASEKQTHYDQKQVLLQCNDKKSEEDKSFVNNQSHDIINSSGIGLQNLVASNSNLNEIETLSQSDVKRKKYSPDENKRHSRSLSVDQSESIRRSLSRDDEEDQDSGPSEVPPALTPLGSREISHESLNRIISIHVSRESIGINNSEKSTMMDCGLQVSEEEIARTMNEHPLAALSNGNISTVSSFNIGDAFSDCVMRDRTRNQFDQLARLREIFTSQLAMAEVIPAFRIGDSNSVYSEPAFRFNTGNESVYSEPAYRPPSPRCGSCRQSLNISKTPSQTSVPSLKGIMEIVSMDQYALLRHPDGASDPNLQKTDITSHIDNVISSQTNLKSLPLPKYPISTNITETENDNSDSPVIPLLQLNTSSEAYDSGHDSSTPRTSKYSGMSRRAESGYHSVATGRDSDELSFTSASVARERQQQQQQNNNKRISIKKKRQDKSLCNWLRSPFTCTYPETEGEISDF